MPLGWLIVVFRQNENRNSPAPTKCNEGARIAIWQTDIGGIDWLDALVRKDDAHFLAFNGGYPYEYTAPAKHLLPAVIAGPPLANSIWRRDFWDIITPGYLGRTDVQLDVAASCAPDEWLYVQAWDES